jgi:uncharacterized protein (TIGR02611 family)
MAMIINQAKKLVIGVIGFTVLFIGVVMLVLPGPAIIIIPAGLAILATQFVWARNLLQRVKSTIQKKTEEDKNTTD